MRGINTKLHETFHHSILSEYSIIAVTETWLNSSVADSEIFDTSKYTVLRCDRDFANTHLSRGGGVCIAVKNCLKPIDLSLKKNTNFKNLFNIDIVGVKITIDVYVYYIIVLYIPPNNPVQLLDSVTESLSTLNYLYNKNLLLIGDFNISDYSNWIDNHISSVFTISIENFSNFLELSQNNYIRNSNGKILDLVLTNFQCEVSLAADSIVPIDSHHPPLLICFETTLQSKQNRVKSNGTFYNFKRADLHSLYQTLGTTCWDFLKDTDNIEDAFEQFYSKLYQIINEFVPTGIRNNRKYPAWFNNDIIKCIKQKHNCFKKYKSHNDPVVFQQFRDLRRYIKSEVDRCYKSYCREIEQNIKDNPSKFWSLVNNKRKLNSLPITMTYNDLELTDYDTISQTFSRYFSSSFAHMGDANYTLTDSNIGMNFTCNELSVNDVYLAMKKIKPKFTMGPDRIPGFLIHDCAHVLSWPLTILFNLSLSNNIFPAILKQSKIIPVFKSGIRNDIKNYRPITIINNFSKVFEITLNVRIYSHVKHLLSDYQHGFIKGRSTVTNLFCLTDYISNSIDNNTQVDVIYTDLSKAFDKLDHKILISKFNNFGFSSSFITFLWSYLRNRVLYVECNGFKSSNFVATSGVPQGSVLGPLFFNIFINDIVDELQVKCLLYADDLKIYYNINCNSDCIMLQSALEKVYHWCQKNLLDINIAKCNVVSFGLKSNMLTFDYRLNNCVLPKSKTFKDLGVTFDHKLSFIPHLNNVINDSFRLLGFVIRNSKEFLEISTLKLLYFSFVRSKLEYATIIWSPHYKIHINNLEQVQRKFLKFLSFKQDGVYPAIGFPHSDLLDRFSISSLENRRSINELIFLYKLIHGIYICPNLLEKLNFHAPIIRTRHNTLLSLPIPRTTLQKYSPLYRICYKGNLNSSLDLFTCSIASIKKLNCISY